MCEKLDPSELKTVVPLHQDDVHGESDARASPVNGDSTKTTEIIPQKKRKTRRGKCKRRNVHPYVKNYRKSGKVMRKPEAPHNSNQFLLEDHGNMEELDRKIKYVYQPSTSNVSRTRDSSFSVDNDSENDEDFYSSPDDEKEFLIKEFDDQYETEHAERLYSMSKNELIQEYLILESKVESLTKRLINKSGIGEEAAGLSGAEKTKNDLESEIDRLMLENELLRRENSELKSKVSISCTSDSADSETDSSDSCSSSSSGVSRPESPIVDYAHTNGHSSPSVQIS